MERVICIMVISIMMQTCVESRFGIARTNNDVKKCGEIPPDVLKLTMGSSFNKRYVSTTEFTTVCVFVNGFSQNSFRYMSLHLPKEDEESEPRNAGGKRNAEEYIPFYVDDTYVEELSNRPAWEVTDFTELDKTELPQKNTMRDKRSSNPARKENRKKPEPKRQWECHSKIKWIDLGDDYYPRYLRTVECLSEKCFYQTFLCKPRAFDVKILRRKRGVCVESKYKMDNDDDLKELWVWEERAVNFCCDCAMRIPEEEDPRSAETSWSGGQKRLFQNWGL